MTRLTRLRFLASALHCQWRCCWARLAAERMTVVWTQTAQPLPLCPAGRPLSQQQQLLGHRQVTVVVLLGIDAAARPLRSRLPVEPLRRQCRLPSLTLMPLMTRLSSFVRLLGRRWLLQPRMRAWVPSLLQQARACSLTPPTPVARVRQAARSSPLVPALLQLAAQRLLPSIKR